MRYEHIYDSKININHYLNIKHNWKKLEDEYLNSNPSILIIDNFLDPIALDEIRNYLLESNIWNEKYHHSNYLGAFCGKGNFSDIHYGIIAEMKTLLPNPSTMIMLDSSWMILFASLTVQCQINNIIKSTLLSFLEMLWRATPFGTSTLKIAP